MTYFTCSNILLRRFRDELGLNSARPPRSQCGTQLTVFADEYSDAIRSVLTDIDAMHGGDTFTAQFVKVAGEPYQTDQDYEA